jgi:hypothetical protein
MFDTTIGRRSALRRIGLALGGVATAPLAPALLSGCRTPGDDYAYQTLGADQQRTLAALVDQILPPTDTPGAAEAGVPQFVDLMLSEWYAPDERDRFLAGLADVDAEAEGGSFVALDPEAQMAYVADLDAREFDDPEIPAADAADGDVAESAQEGMYKAGEEEEREVAGLQGDLGAAQDDDARTPELPDDEESMGAREVDELGNEVDRAPAEAGPSFYRQLKELTVAGYYTSEAGATEELQYNAVMGRYDPDVPLAEIGRAWA